MLPVTFQFIIAMVAYAINEQLARRIEYLLEEVRVLREVYIESTGRKRIPFTDEQRRRLAIKGKALTPEERETRNVRNWIRRGRGSSTPWLHGVRSPPLAHPAGCSCVG
jgi:hypothetical protein